MGANKAAMNTSKAQAGLSLIEMMVGLAIGLIAILIIGQVTAMFEGQKRTTTGGSDAQTNAGVSLRELTKEINMAGYGIINAGLSDKEPGNQICSLGINVYYNGTVVSDPGKVPAPTDGGILAPVRIVDGATPAGDSIIVVRSDAEYGVLTTKVNKPVTTSPPLVTVDSALGYQPGQLFLIGSTDGKKRCSLLQLSGTPTQAVGTTWSAWELPFAASASYPYNTATPKVTFADFPDYAVGDVVINMGYSPTTGNISADRSFIYRNYHVECNKLAIVDPSQVAGPYTCANTTPLVDEIVSMQAQYGIALAGSQAVDHWIDAKGIWAYDKLTAAQINLIKAVRIAVVSRSPQLEKTMVSPATLTLWTTLKAGDDPAPTYTVPDQHYRYSVQTTVVPVKNVIWGKLQ